MSMTVLKCDAEGCAHIEEAVICEKNIGKPCPVCGANLLTREDYNAFKPIMEMIESLKGLGLLSNTDDPWASGPGTVICVAHHNGKTTLDFTRVGGNEKEGGE